VAVNIGGNPLTILLRILLSTGNGTNGIYDVYDAENGLGIDASLINVSHIEEMRDKWFAGVRFDFTIRERLAAKEFLETEIFKPCNIYPIIKGDGTFDITVYHPPTPMGAGNYQNFNHDTIIGLPKWNQNLSELINEVEFHIDYNSTGKVYDNEYFYTDSDSVANRGPGKKTLKIESQGITTAKSGIEFITRRKTRVFQRYASPPPTIVWNAFFSRHLSEVGDIVPVTHTKLPNFVTAGRGIIDHYVEIINRQVDWKKGLCKFTGLYTGWTSDRYAATSPTGTVKSATTEKITLVAGHGSKFDANWKINVYNRSMTSQANNRTIASRSSDVLTLTTNIATAPSSDYIVTFVDYDNASTDQKTYAFTADATTQLGSANNKPYLTC